MGDAADDVFDAMMREQITLDLMRQAGCRPCPRKHLVEQECPICFDLGWIDAGGNPCEP